MLSILIPTLIAAIVFISYNAAVISNFGVPVSLSDTFYLWNKTKTGRGYLFTIMMLVISTCLMPGWMTLTETISSWSHNLTFLPFISAASLAFVGIAPAFKDCDIEYQVHMTAAYCAVSFAMIWCIVVCYHITWIILPSWMIIIWAIAYVTKTYRTCAVYWWEMVAIGSTLTTIIAESIS